MRRFYKVWPEAVASEFCDLILERASARPIAEHNGERTVRPLPEHENVDIASVLLGYLRTSNFNDFGAAADFSESFGMQTCTYEGTSKDGFVWHTDWDPEDTSAYCRKLSLVLQLSDPADYEGGRFEFCGCPSPGAEFKERGSILVFPSYRAHRVTPVTKGSRTSLVTWVWGPQWV
jgi:PKHD-type hydroxylase